MNDSFKPRNQADCDHANALREYEAAHKVWMNTPVHTEAGQRARYEKDCARDKYTKAVKASHPEWSVI